MRNVHWLFIVLSLGLLGRVVHAQDVVETFFTENGPMTPVSLRVVETLGQRFTATQPFEGIEVFGPTYSVDGEKGLTLRLWEWQGDYDTTVAQEPLAQSILIELNDNSWFPLYAPEELPPGEYFWQASNPTNLNPDGNLDVGAWLWEGSTFTGGEAFIGGEPADSMDGVTLQWSNIFAEGQTGTNTPFPFTFSQDDQGNNILDPDSSLAQQFFAIFDFQGVAFASPTYHGENGGYRMRLFEWNTDFDTTVTQTPIAEKQFENIVDNARNDLILDSVMPAGDYLLMIDQPVPSDQPPGFGSEDQQAVEGLIGVWGWTESNFASSFDAAFQDGERLEGVTFQLWLAEPAQQGVGNDFASRSVTGVAGMPVEVKQWNLY